MLSSIDDLKLVLREAEVPFFTDAELKKYVDICSGDYDEAAYHCFLAKAENTQLQISGMSTQDTSKYYLRLARRYKPKNSGQLGW